MGNPPFGYPEEFRDKVLSRIKENKKNTIQDNDQNCVIIDWGKKLMGKVNNEKFSIEYLITKSFHHTAQRFYCWY